MQFLCSISCVILMLYRHCNSYVSIYWIRISQLIQHKNCTVYPFFFRIRIAQSILFSFFSFRIRIAQSMVHTWLFLSYKFYSFFHEKMKRKIWKIKYYKLLRFIYLYFFSYFSFHFFMKKSRIYRIEIVMYPV